MTIIRSTMQHPYYLAHIALVHKLHARGLLEHELKLLLRGSTSDIAMTFVNDEPVCVALLSEYMQLMSFTHVKFRRQGLATRTAKLLSRRTQFKFDAMVGGVGRQADVSRAFFTSLGVEVDEG